MSPSNQLRFTFSNLPSVGWESPVQGIADLASMCEQVGFDRFAVADIPHHYDCATVMTACLLSTENLVVEGLVTNPYTRNPTLQAATWATMADLSGGRVIFGLGAGVESASQVWTSPWGTKRPHPVTAVREAVEVSRRVWSGEMVDYEGEIVRASKAQLRFPVRHEIPVLVAARGKRMLELAGEIADVAHLASLFVNVDHHRENLASVAAGAARAGRSSGFEIDLSLPVTISRDREEARWAARRTAAQVIMWMAGTEKFSRIRDKSQRPNHFNVPENIIDAIAKGWDVWSEAELPEDLATMITDEILDEFAIAGEPSECAERMKNLAAELPEITGFRVKLPRPVGPAGQSDYAEMIDQFAAVIHDVKSDVKSTVGGRPHPGS